jgi:hypothetical protein
MERGKVEIIIEGIALIILLALCVGVVINGNTLSCDKCLVGFESKTSAFQVPVQDLYNNLQEGKCYIYPTDNGFSRLFETK